MGLGHHHHWFSVLSTIYNTQAVGEVQDEASGFHLTALEPEEDDDNDAEFDNDDDLELDDVSAES